MQFVDVVRDIVRHWIGGVALRLNRATGGRLSANTVTLVALVAHVLIALLIMAKHLWWAALLLVIFGLMDVLDGELARLQHKASPLGRLLDSVADRLKEVLLYTAVAYHIIANTGRPLLGVWAVAACGTALCVSYLNAWGEAVLADAGHKGHVMNKTLRVGIGGFEIRLAVLFIGLLSGRLTLAMIVITILSLVTIAERFTAITKRLRDV